LWTTGVLESLGFRIAYLMAIYLGKLTTMKEYEDMKGAVTRLEHLIGSPEVIQ